MFDIVRPSGSEHKFSRLLSTKAMLETPNHHSQNSTNSNGNSSDEMLPGSQGSRSYERVMENQKITSQNTSNMQHTCDNPCGEVRPPSDMDLMKERFAKLLLGEDMSGGGKGVSSALALSNAITNLAVSVFGEQYRLKPMSVERKLRWRKETDWILSVTDHIVEFVPSHQTNADGVNMEIMVTRQRNDLLVNIPALRKLDAMLIEYLDNFKDQNEFSYVSRDERKSEKGHNQQRQEDRWWLPTAKVPPNGLSEVTRKWLQYQKDSVNQVLKAAMAINSQVLSEMEIPDVYIDTLPKNGRACLGDSIYRSITDDYFNPYKFLSSLDLSTEHKILDLKNRIEASIVIWKRKMNQKDGKPSWSSSVSMEKRELFGERAESILILLKQKYPGVPQSALDISKIQYNKDVGHSVLESYSRVLESMAFTIISRIDDVLYADNLIKNHCLEESRGRSMFIGTDNNGRLSLSGSKISNPAAQIQMLTSINGPISMTLSDFIGCQFEQESETQKKDPFDLIEFTSLEETKETNPIKKKIKTPKKFSYIENLGVLRSPTVRR